MVSPTRIRESVAALPGPKERAAFRAAEVKASVFDIAQGTRIRRGDLTIEFDAAPQFVLDPQGAVVGIDALVRVFRGAAELQVDPHRVCINPPTLVPDGTTHTETDPFTGAQYQVSNHREDPREAYLTWLEQSLRGVPNAGGFRTRGTVTTVFATAPGGNGFISCTSTGSNYSTARLGTGTLGAGNNHSAGQFTFGAEFVCREGFVQFDTSAIPDTDDVSAAVLNLDGVFDGSATDFTATAAERDFGAALPTTADYVSGADLAALTTLATFASAGYVAGYNVFTSEVAFAGAINKTGNTSIILYSSRHSAGTQPTGDEYLAWTDADAAGTTEDPYLDITHAAAAVLAPRSLNINQSVTRAAYW